MQIRKFFWIQINSFVSASALEMRDICVLWLKPAFAILLGLAAFFFVFHFIFVERVCEKYYVNIGTEFTLKRNFVEKN